MTAAPSLALLALAAAFVAATPACAQQSDAQVAEDLDNPVYDQISVPLQNNFDCCYGPTGGPRYTLNVEPVIPFDIGSRLAIVTRTIVPILYEDDNTAGQGSHGGFGDVMESLFVSPKVSRAFAFGVGPAFQLPTGDSQLGSGKWQAGPTFAAGWQGGPVSLSLLIYHLWSFAGDASRSDVSRTRLQPQVSYTFTDSTSLKAGVEADYDWVHRQWTAPVNFGVSHVVALTGGARLQLAIAGKAYAATTGPQAGLRFTATFVLPR